MTLKQFMEENTVTAFDVVPEVLILNVEVDGTEYALDVDTSEIPFGTMLERVEDFTVDGDILTVAGLTLNTSTTNVLGLPETLSE
jgi:hypothetical protein